MLTNISFQELLAWAGLKSPLKKYIWFWDAAYIKAWLIGDLLILDRDLLSRSAIPIMSKDLDSLILKIGPLA